ncbi:ankyrin repeat-containing domain protein [Xylaria sp. FL1777]|nr:ankyrin repeat-containing domain protein [Xylaria sp. FL1777]
MREVERARQDNCDTEILHALGTAHADSTLKLHIAALHGRKDLLEKFLSSETNPISAPDVKYTDLDGKTPLHLAATAGYVNIVIELLKAGFDKNARNKRCRTSLHMASQLGHLRVVKEVLSAEANAAISDEDYLPTIQSSQ